MERDSKIVNLLVVLLRVLLRFDFFGTAYLPPSGELRRGLIIPLPSEVVLVIAVIKSDLRFFVLLSPLFCLRETRPLRLFINRSN